MDFFKEFSKQFSSVARSVSGAPKESAEQTKLNGDLKAAQAALEQLYARYGKACYAALEGRGNRAESEALALRIKAARLELEELTDRRDAFRELRRCLNCGAVFPKEARFCSACGKRLPDDAPKPEPVEIGEYCPGCGAKREGGEPRCPVCGMDFEAPTPPPEPAPLPALPDDAPDIEEPDGEQEE